MSANPPSVENAIVGAIDGLVPAPFKIPAEILAIAILRDGIPFVKRLLATLKNGGELTVAEALGLLDRVSHAPSAEDFKKGPQP
jgi:hypothetical protein